MLEIFAVIQTAVILVGAPLMWLYMRERIKNVARETTDKALSDYKHEHDQALARVTAEYQQRSHGFGLFAQRRNEVYAETFSLFEKVRGGYARHFASLTETRDFSRSPEADLRHLAEKFDAVTEGERKALVDLLNDGRLEQARGIATELYERNSLRLGNRSFYEFKSAWVLYALYFSAAVSDVLLEAAQTLGMLCVYADELIEERPERLAVEDRRKRADLVTKLDDLSSRLRTAMRTEMHPNAVSKEGSGETGVREGSSKGVEETANRVNERIIQKLQRNFLNPSGKQLVAARVIAGGFAFAILAGLFITPFIGDEHNPEPGWNLWGLAAALFLVAINRQEHRRRKRVVTWRSRMLVAWPFATFAWLLGYEHWAAPLPDFSKLFPPGPDPMVLTSVGRGFLIVLMIQLFVIAFAKT